MLLLIHRTWHKVVSPSWTWRTYVCWAAIACAALVIRERRRAGPPGTGDGPPSPPAAP